ncbi:16S rRNA (cytosine(967)-C(5))-methyltransferase RsmB [Oryzomonas rubra]|uniref:16S rRNA (cytosine(967)-C(5))-methyltransferase RsmB n=1 Tax=Oryzomonas rubra TaxID=2509454 RepID=UPI00308412E6
MSALAPSTANPRQAACQVLLRIAKEGGFADRLIDHELEKGHLIGPDRGLFPELVFGVLRRRGSLDHILAQLVDKPLDTLQPQALTILRLGLYQLAYLDRIPESAAVNESVNLARETVPRAGGLINAVLRNYLRRKDGLTFPDPAANPAASIAARHSQPEWLVAQWLGQLDFPEAEALAEASSRQPPLTLRANTLRTTRDELLRLFTESGVSAVPCCHSPHGIQVEGRHQIPTLPGYREGLFCVQDEASQMVALFLAPQPGERVLDCCAAPGGKATHLAQLLANRGELLATDISRTKLPVIREAAQRLGIDCLAVATVDLHRPETFPTGGFDRVLLDAPCSGLGVIRRNPEAKWRLTPDDIQRLAAAQKAMCANAATMVKNGGILVYSTCSTSREENEQVVQDFLSRHPDYVLEDLNGLFPDHRELFTAEGMFRAWPHRHNMDGFFAARLRKL